MGAALHLNMCPTPGEVGISGSQQYSTTEKEQKVIKFSEYVKNGVKWKKTFFPKNYVIYQNNDK